MDILNPLLWCWFNFKDNIKKKKKKQICLKNLRDPRLLSGIICLTLYWQQFLEGGSYNYWRSNPTSLKSVVLLILQRKYFFSLGFTSGSQQGKGLSVEEALLSLKSTFQFHALLPSVHCTHQTATLAILVPVWVLQDQSSSPKWFTFIIYTTGDRWSAGSVLENNAFCPEKPGLHRAGTYRYG